MSSLFRKLLMPTLLGMVSSALFVITDGIFVGRGLGSDALAAVNIVAPLFLINTGLGLMFGVGASVVASIHLSHGKPKTARINVTQAAIALSLVVLTFSMISVFGQLTWRVCSAVRSVCSLRPSNISMVLCRSLYSVLC